jgi:hypothetical protein
MLRRTLVRSVMLIITFDVHNRYHSFFHPTKPTPSRFNLTIVQFRPSKEEMVYNCKMTLAACTIALLNDAVSDTTKDDSSNIARYIIINLILKN